MTYRIDLDALTIIGTDKYGEKYDLNAQGDACQTTSDLRELIIELCEQGAFDTDVRDALLDELTD